MPRILIPVSALGAVGLTLVGLAVAQGRKHRRDGTETTVKAITIRREPRDVEEYLRQIGHTDRVRVSPAPGGRGSELRIQKDDSEAPNLRQLKQVLETGEVAVSDATVQRTDLLQRHAQPVGANA